jgi:hypothetical protein
MNEIKIIETLTGAKPLSFRRLDDGSFVVINAMGQKLIFTRQQVKAVETKLLNTTVISTKPRSTKGKE